MSENSDLTYRTLCPGLTLQRDRDGFWLIFEAKAKSSMHFLPDTHLLSDAIVQEWAKATIEGRHPDG